MLPLAILTITATLATPQAVRAQQIDVAACDPAAGKAGVKMLKQLVELAAPCRFDGPDRPTLAMTDLDGAPVSLTQWRGRVVLVNLWATWCQPCLREMPSLQKLQQTLGGDRFQVVAISQDLGGAAQVKPYLERNALTGLVVTLDPKTTAGKVFSAPGLPVSILLDAQGHEIARLTGEADWAAPEMVARVRRLGGL